MLKLDSLHEVIWCPLWDKSTHTVAPEELFVFLTRGQVTQRALFAVFLTSGGVE